MNYLWVMPRSHVKMRLKKAPQRLNFVIAKPKTKDYALVVAANAPALSRNITHSNAASCLIKKPFYVKLKAFP